MDVQAFHLMPWQDVDDTVAWPFSDDAFDAEKGPALYEDYLTEMAYCDELGFDAVAVNEHHYSAYGLMPSPNLIAGNLAARTDDIDIALYGNVIPLRGNPIRVAEEIAMLDNMSGGRVSSGFVRGIPSEYVAYGIDRDTSRDRFKEAWELIVKAWTEEEPFDWDGEFWQYDDVYIWPRPVQDPHPPIWMPAKHEESIKWAVEKRVPVGRVYVGTDKVKETFDQYRAFAEEDGWDPPEDRFTPARFIYVAETMEQARAEAEEHLAYFYERLLAALYRSGAVMSVGDAEYQAAKDEEYASNMPPIGQKASDFDFDALQASGEIIVGDPSYVVEEIESQYDTLGGFGTLINFFHFGTLPHDLTMKSLERFADDVLPELRKI